jgi:hypothetical protein
MDRKAAKMTTTARRRRGETFGQFWARIDEQTAMQIALASKRAGVLPQSFFNTLIRYEDEE